ncbi:MAG: FG-GAP repeat protein [Planctomycetes bacterium]|nr:FG-GAP repeat protein [Planctomycetota bacterium]
MKPLTPIIFTCLSSALAAQSTGNWSVENDISGLAQGDFGLTVLASAGDVNGDGFADILVGAGGASPTKAYAGSAYIYSGATHEQLFRVDGSHEAELLGASVLSLADVNSDGYIDILIGAPGRDRVTMHSGLNGKIIYRINGPISSDLGRSLVKVSDQDGDGIPEFAAGSPNYSEPDATLTGGITIFSGASGQRLNDITPLANSAHHGRILAACGDLDGDGEVDFMTSAWMERTQWIMCYSGADSSEIMRMHLATGGFGSIETLANGGDLNQDGVDDILVGTPQRTVSGKAGTGSVFIMSGSNGKILQRIDGMHAGGGFGVSLLGNVDMNHDGYNDIMISSVKKIIGWGWVYTYSGLTGELMSSYRSTQRGDEFGHSMATIGDTDGDGYNEIAIAAPAYDGVAGTDTGAILIADFD